MIVHAVQFDRPISGARLVHGPFDREPGSFAGSADVAEPPGSEPTADEGNGGTTANSQMIEKRLSEIACGIKRLESQTSQQVDQLQTLSIELATRIVEQMVGSSETTRIARVERLLRKSLGRSETPIAAFVHPQDFSQLEKFLESIDLVIQPDPSLELGECRVEFASYDLVSSLQQQLEQIETGLREALNDA